MNNSHKQTNSFNSLPNQGPPNSQHRNFSRNNINANNYGSSLNRNITNSHHSIPQQAVTPPQPDMRMAQNNQPANYQNQAFVQNYMPNVPSQSRVINNQRAAYPAQYTQMTPQGQLFLLCNSNYPNASFINPPFNSYSSYYTAQQISGAQVQPVPIHGDYISPVSSYSHQPLPTKEKKIIEIKDPETSKVYLPSMLANDEDKQQPDSLQAIEKRAEFSNKVLELLEQDTKLLVSQEMKHSVTAKEFVPEQQQFKSSEKPTPIVSAMSDGAEVTISSKGSKERESPIKNQKNRSKFGISSTNVMTTATATLTTTLSTSMATVTTDTTTESIASPTSPSLFSSVEPSVSTTATACALNVTTEPIVATVDKNELINVTMVKKSYSSTVMGNKTITENYSSKPMNYSEVVHSKEVKDQPVSQKVVVTSVQNDTTANNKVLVNHLDNKNDTNVEGVKNKLQRDVSNKTVIEPIVTETTIVASKISVPISSDAVDATVIKSSTAIAATIAHTISVPETQPPKSTSKSNKMKDLNLKGAQLEGSDMDAFKFKEDEKKSETIPAVTITTTTTNMTYVNANTTIVVPKKNTKKDKDVITSNSSISSSVPISVKVTDSKVAPVPETIKIKTQHVVQSKQKQKSQNSNVDNNKTALANTTVVTNNAKTKSTKSSNQMKPKAGSPPANGRAQNQQKDKENKPAQQKVHKNQLLHDVKAKSSDAERLVKPQKDNKKDTKGTSMPKSDVKNTAAPSVNTTIASSGNGQETVAPKKLLGTIVTTQTTNIKFDVTNIVTETTIPATKPVYQIKPPSASVAEKTELSTPLSTSDLLTATSVTLSTSNVTLKKTFDQDTFPKAFKTDKGSLLIYADKFSSKTYSYRDDQWAPWKTSGDKVYEIEFLFSFQSDKRCQTNVSLRLEPNMEFLKRDANSYRQSSNYSSRGMSLQSRGSIPKRGSLQGRNSSMKGSNLNMGPKISLSLELNDNIKFATAEKAWVPTVKREQQQGAPVVDNEKEQVCKYIRSLLNKLTPENFEKLVPTAEKCNMSGREDLIEDVSNITFDKAISEPVFASTYACFCFRMTKSGKDPNQAALFNKALVSRCQYEFERKDDIYEIKKRQEIEACTDLEKKRELQAEFDEKERAVRKRAVGNIKFIGELYKVGLLPGKIMTVCIKTRANDVQEHSIEGLCKLLTTVGQKLEAENGPLDELFGTLREIVENRTTDISKRIRFMIQDVIDLRKNKWKFVTPNSQANKPMDSIKLHGFSDSMNRSNMSESMDKKRAKAPSNSLSGGIGGSGNVWQTVQKSKNSSYQIQSSKLKPQNLDTSGMNLGTSQQFSNWSKGSSIKTQTYTSHSSITNLPSNESSAFRSSRPSNEYKSEKQFPVTSSNSNTYKKPDETFKKQSIPVNAKPTPPLNFDNIFSLLLIDHLEDSSFEFYNSPEVKKTITQAGMDKYILELINFVLQKSKLDYKIMSEILYELLNRKLLLTTNLLNCLKKEIIPALPDIKCDTPKAIEYLMIFLHLSLSKDLIKLSELKTACFDNLNGPDSNEMFVSLIEQFRVNNSQIILKSLWNESHLDVRDFVQKSFLEKFQFTEQAKFLISSLSATSVNRNDQSLQNKFIDLLKSDRDPYEMTANWISNNLSAEMRNDVNVLKLFVTAICHCSVVPVKDDNKGNFKFDANILTNQWKIVEKCFFNNHEEKFELVCLSAILSYMEQIQHPKGVWTDIFQALYAKDLISIEGFLAWKEKGESEPGKGVAIHSLLSFYSTLDHEDSEEEEDL